MTELEDSAGAGCREPHVTELMEAGLLARLELHPDERDLDVSHRLVGIGIEDAPHDDAGPGGLRGGQGARFRRHVLARARRDRRAGWRGQCDEKRIARVRHDRRRCDAHADGIEQRMEDADPDRASRHTVDPEIARRIRTRRPVGAVDHDVGVGERRLVQAVDHDAGDARVPAAMRRTTVLRPKDSGPRQHHHRRRYDQPGPPKPVVEGSGRRSGTAHPATSRGGSGTRTGLRHQAAGTESHNRLLPQCSRGH